MGRSGPHSKSCRIIPLCPFPRNLCPSLFLFNELAPPRVGFSKPGPNSRCGPPYLWPFSVQCYLFRWAFPAHLKIDPLLILFCPPYSAYFFFFKFFIARYWLYNILLVSAIHQHESATGIHMSPPSWTSLPSPTTYLVLFITLPDILFMYLHLSVFPQFGSVQSLSCVWLFATPWTAVC